MDTNTPSRGSAKIGFLLLVLASVLGIAGTDLILPAVPGLPAALGGTLAQAQLVLASFVAGTSIGLLLFGELGARFDQRRLLVISLLAYGAVSAIAVLSPSLDVLVALRFVQGAAGSAAAVFAPGMIRALFSEAKAVRAIGLFGSIESLAPALAPVAGVSLLAIAGWQSSFGVIAAVAVILAAAIALMGSGLPSVRSPRGAGGYLKLLRDGVFLRYALSQAFILGGLLVFVFGAPTVITVTMGGQLTDFIIMQVSGILFYIFGANITGRLTEHFGPERVIFWGSLMSAAGLLVMFAYALSGGNQPLMLAFLFVPVNLGLGFRGPPGFFHAVLASHGDDARGAALVILAILLTTAAGTTAVAPLITEGLLALSAAAAAISVAGVISLLVLPKLARTPP
jgi:MFS family permease